MVRLGPNQGQSIYNKFVKAAKILDIPRLPKIYISNRPTINAYAYGIENYQIVLFSGLIDSMTEEELFSVIGHELGHIKCEHMLYKTTANIIRLFGLEFLKSLLPVGTGMLAAMPLLLAVLHWERMAEFTCDRAALLVVQDKNIVASALSKLAGGSEKILPEINLEEILQQADEYHDTSNDFLEQIFKVNMMLMQTHPFPIVRVKEILDWAKGEQYQQILAGDYLLAGVPSAMAIDSPIGKICPNCSQLAGQSATKCSACGHSLQAARLVCGQCRVKVFSTWQACPNCGNQLQPNPTDAVAVEEV
jgi:hypothetical protein